MKAMMLIGVAGLATAAGAQSATVVFETDATTYAIGEDITWTVSIDWSFPGVSDAYVFGLELDLISTMDGNGGAFVPDAVILADPLMAISAPTSNGADFLTLLYTDLHALTTGHPGGGADPFVIGSFTVAYTQAGTASYDALTIAGQNGVTLARGAFATHEPWVVQYDVVSDEIRWTPAPGSLGMMFFGGLIAIRRRR